MAVTFECTTTIEASQPAVFDLSLSVDAHLESMAGSRERVMGIARHVILDARRRSSRQSRPVRAERETAGR